MSNIAFPYAISTSGRTVHADDEAHIGELIEQLLFTVPGERVNRPTFGSGVMQLVFAPASEALVAAMQASVQAALHLWLGDRIDIDGLAVTAADATVTVELSYRIRLTQQPVRARFQRSF